MKLPSFFLDFLFFGVFCPLSLLAQGYSYAHYDDKDGLTGTTVYRMAQDHDGFIWFATETGLSRFDGTHFANFSIRDGLPDNEITNVFVDSKNRVWCMPFNRKIAYYWKGRIYNETNDTVLAKLNLTTAVLSVAEDSSGDIILHQNTSLVIIHPDASISNVNNILQKIPFGFVQAGANQQGGFRLFVMIENGTGMLVDVKDGKHVPVEYFHHLDMCNPITTYIGPRLNVIAQHDSLLFIDPVDNHRFEIPMPPGFIGISHLDDSLITLNGYSYTYLLNLREKRITDTFMKDQTVSNVLRDSEGDLWFSTLGKGVYRLGSTEIRTYGIKAGIDNNNLGVASLYEFDSILYAGCDRFHLLQIDRRGRLIRNDQITGKVTRGRIIAMVKNKSGQIMLGTDGGEFISQGRRFIPHEVPGILAVKYFYAIGDSLLLECSNIVIRMISLKDFKFLRYLWHGRTTCVCIKEGKYYIGTLDGLYQSDGYKATVFLGSRDKAFQNRIWDLTVSPDGMLWVATNGFGLLGYRDGKIVTRIGREQGLTSDICRKLFIRDSVIWVGTDKGLNKITFSGNRYTILPYTSGDGLNSDIINAIYVRGNEVFVGTPEGLNVFDENRLSAVSTCHLRIVGISNSERRWPSDTSDFRIAHRHNDIQFDYVGISFKSVGHLAYQYRLLGLDDQWKTTDQTTLAYPSLPSGSYELQLQATNKFGVQSAIARIDFVIEKSFWENGWTRAALLVLIGGLIALVFAYRVRVIRKKEAEKSETIARIAELEHMALRSQMNPHFIFNCLNSIQDYVMDRDILGVNEFIANFARLIRLTLDQSARPRITLSEEVSYISTYLELEKRRFDDKFVYEVMVAPQIDPDEFQIPPMMIQPYAENAVRHGINSLKDRSGKIRISFEVDAGYLVCQVRDNGVGRKESTKRKGRFAIQYQSQGMSLTAKRVEMLNRLSGSRALIDILDLENPAGTLITLRFPLSGEKEE